MSLSCLASRLRHCVLSLTMVWSACFTTHARASDSDCMAALPDNLLAQEHFAGGVVAFQHVRQAVDHDSEIQVVHYPPDENCLAVVVDNYEFNGGLPNLEASFVYSIQGEPNLFAIVSWPLLHAGLGMNGRYYGVHAYQPSGAALVLNTFVAHNAAVSSGIVGTYEGEESTFEGTTEDGLISLMTSQGKWSWQAVCNPSGKQLELNACAYVAQIEAFEEIQAARQGLIELYADDPDIMTDKLDRFDNAQQVWQVQLQHDLDSLIPLLPGENPSFVYGSSYSMQYAYTQAFLIRQRAEFLRTDLLNAQ